MIKMVKRKLVASICCHKHHHTSCHESPHLEESDLSREGSFSEKGSQVSTRAKFISKILPNSRVAFSFKSAIKRTEERLQKLGSKNSKRFNDTRERLVRRIENLRFIEKLTNDSTGDFNIEGILGWGKQCSLGNKTANANRRGISEFDTFYLISKYTGEKFMLQLDSSIKAQLNKLTRYARKEGYVPPVATDPSFAGIVQTYNAGGTCSQEVFFHGRWYEHEESAHEKISQIKYVSDMQGATSTPIDDLVRAIHEERGDNPFWNTVLDVLEREICPPGNEFHSKKVKFVFEQPKSVSSGGLSWMTGVDDEGRAKVDVLSVNRSMKGLPLIEYLASECLKNEDSRLYNEEQVERYASVIKNYQETGGHVENLPDEKKAYYPFTKNIPFHSVTQASEYRVKAAAALLNASRNYPFINPIPVSYLDDPSKVSGYEKIFIEPDLAKELLEKFKEVVKTEAELMVNWVEEVVLIWNSKHPEKNVKEEDVLCAFLYNMKIIKQFFDHTGMCCPTCQSEGGNGEHQHKTNTQFDVLTPMIFSDENKPISNIKLDRKKITSPSNIAEKIMPVIESFSKHIDGFQNLDMFHDQMKSYQECLQNYKVNNIFKTAMMMDYVYNLVMMIHAYNVDDRCRNEIDYLNNLIYELTRTFCANPQVEEGGCNYKSRFHLASLVDRTVSYLKLEKVSVSGIRSKKVLDVSKLDLKNDDELEFAAGFRVISSEPQTGVWDVRIPFEKQLFRLLGPIEMHTLTGFLGVGKTSLVNQVISYGSGNYYVKIKTPSGNQYVPVGLEMNDAAGAFDAKKMEKKVAGSSDSDEIDATEQNLVFFMKKEDFDHLEEEFKQVGIRLTEKVVGPNEKESTSDAGNLVQVSGCICCKDRDIHIQKMSDYNNGSQGGVAGAPIRMIFTEPTGIADGKGIENAALVPLGRLFHNYLYVMIDPSVPRWNRLIEISRVAQQKYGQDITIDDLDDDKIEDLGLEGIDVVYLNQLTHVTQVILNSRGASDCVKASDLGGLLKFGGAHPKAKVLTRNLLTDPLDGLGEHHASTPPAQLEIDKIKTDLDLEGELVKMGLFAKGFKIESETGDDISVDECVRILKKYAPTIERCKGYIRDDDGQKIEIHISSDHQLTVNGQLVT